MIVDPRHAGRSRYAAESEHRHASHVGTQSDARGDPRLQSGNRQTGHRRGVDDVDVGRTQARLVQGAEHRGTAQFHGVLDEQVVGAAEVVQGGVILQRQDHVAGVHLCTAVQLPDGLLVLGIPGNGQQRIGHLLLRVAVLGQLSAYGGNHTHGTSCR